MIEWLLNTDLYKVKNVNANRQYSDVIVSAQIFILKYVIEILIDNGIGTVDFSGGCPLCSHRIYTYVRWATTKIKTLNFFSKIELAFWTVPLFEDTTCVARGKDNEGSRWKDMRRWSLTNKVCASCVRPIKPKCIRRAKKGQLLLRFP